MTHYTNTNHTVLPRANSGFTLRMMLDVWRQRQQLKDLDHRALEDIGVTPAQAHKEAKRKVWDVPGTWRL